MVDQAKAMVTEDVCAETIEQHSSTPHNIVQERPLFFLEGHGKAMLTEDMCEQDVQQNSSTSLNVVQGEPLLLLRSSNEDRRMQKLPVVADESLMTMDLIGVGSQPNSMEPHNIAPTMEPLDIAPTVGAFTVQCAQCMKWRFIPTKEQYEAIRQSILEKPFFCSSAAIWRPNASCRDPLEISPDLHELWAVDRPSIPLPPHGWERLLVIRPQGSSKFADIYYITPSGRKLRSMPEIVRYLEEHPEYANAGLNQFSFLTPKPLDKDYCRRKNESLTSDEKGTLSQKKSYSKNFSVESHLRKIGTVQSSSKGISSKPKLEKLKCRKKALTGVIIDGESRVFQAQEQSVDSLDCKQVSKTTLPSEELEKKTVWNCGNATAGLEKIVNAFVTSPEQHPVSSRTEVQGAACHVK